MEIIRHRVNTIAELDAVDPAHGVEIDIRSNGRRLVLAHDPFVDGESLDDYLGRYAALGRRGLVIFNPKEDGLETEILSRARQAGLARFFLLDLALPTLVRLAAAGRERAVAVRVSEYEPAEAARRFAGLAEWVWLDCFSGEPASPATVRELGRSFHICLVSPELQGYPPAAIARFLPLRDEVEAVCTKHPARWGTDG